MVSNTDHALSLTCDEFNVQVNDYTAAPIFMNKEGKGGHEWLVEFLHPLTIYLLLQGHWICISKINSDYEAKEPKT